jgi:putative ABC transport system permease protein
VSTALAQRPAGMGTGDGDGPARRAVVRWAWRLFRHEWRQQLLVLALLTVAVAASILGAAIGTNTPPPANAGFGTANYLITLPGSDRHLTADIAAIKAHFGTVDVIENASLATGTVQGAQLRAQDPSGPYGRPMLALVSGRYPSGADEVAMTSQLASTFSLRIGGVWEQGGHTWRVVGLVENPQNLLDNFALVAPGELAAPGEATVLFDATPASAAAFTFPNSATPQIPQPNLGLSPAVVVGAFAIFGLIFIGLVATAGFTVMAQRRLRALGILSSLGATDRNVGLVMIANGAVVGAVAALIGAVLGFAAWIAYAPHLAASAHHRVVWTNLPWWLIATAMALAVMTATLAARRPARAVARIPVVAALSGRPVPPQAVHRSAVPAIVLLVAGPVLLAFSGGLGGNSGKDALFQLGGLLATAAGVLLFAPLAIAVLAVISKRTPIAVRLALRDLARYRARSGAALAAASFAVLIAMLTVLLATGRYADAVDYFGPNLPANQLIVYTPGNAPGSGGPGSAGPGPAVLHSRVSAIAASLGSHSVLALEASNAVLAQNTQGGLHGGGGQLYIATPALLRHYGINPRAISPATVLITSRPGLAGTPGLRLVYGLGGAATGPLTVKSPKIQFLSKLPTDTSDPSLLVTTYAAHRLRLPVSPGGWLIQTARPLTSPQINAARQLAAAAGMTIETRSEALSLDELRNWAAAAGILLALGVLAMTIGLIRSEAAADLRSLTASGANSWIRRTITGATGGALGLLAAVLGTGVAYLATAAFFRSQLSERMSHVPVLDLLLILVGLPLAATAGSWLFGGRQPPAIARQPLE